MSSSSSVHGWRIARVGGIDYVVRPSLLVMGAVLVAVFTQRFDDAGRAQPLTLALGFVIGLYVSVFVHELAHVIAARGFGMRVRSVTLHLLGGETAIEGESRTPRQELAVAIVGPLASLAIGLTCLSLDDTLTGTAADLLTTTGWVNVVVAVFNLVPGLPLDGGRVLRALIWGVLGDESTGTRVAAWIGRATALAVVVYALLRPRGDGYLLDLAIGLLVAWFLWVGAGAALERDRYDRRVSGLVARDLADPPVLVPPDAPPLDADLRGRDLLRALADRPATSYTLVEPDGRVVGVLTMAALDDAYRRTR